MRFWSLDLLLVSLAASKMDEIVNAICVSHSDHKPHSNQKLLKPLSGKSNHISWDKKQKKKIMASIDRNYNLVSLRSSCKATEANGANSENVPKSACLLYKLQNMNWVIN